MSHTDAFHTSLALIDHLAVLVPRIYMHDHKLARAMRSMATAIPHLIAAAEAAPLARAHKAAGRIHIMLDVVQAWGYVLPEDLTEARDTARRLHALTAPAQLARRGAAGPAVVVREHLYRGLNWTIAYHNEVTAARKEGPQAVRFEVPVPARGSALLVYRVVYTWQG